MFAETLDAIKFICKDIWAACWDKQVDNLRTNHRVPASLDVPPFGSNSNYGSFCRVSMCYKITHSSPYLGFLHGNHGQTQSKEHV